MGFGSDLPPGCGTLPGEEPHLRVCEKCDDYDDCKYLDEEEPDKCPRIAEYFKDPPEGWMDGRTKTIKVD